MLAALSFKHIDVLTDNQAVAYLCTKSHFSKTDTRLVKFLAKFNCCASRIRKTRKNTRRSVGAGWQKDRLRDQFCNLSIDKSGRHGPTKIGWSQQLHPVCSPKEFFPSQVTLLLLLFAGTIFCEFLRFGKNRKIKYPQKFLPTHQAPWCVYHHKLRDVFHFGSCIIILFRSSLPFLFFLYVPSRPRKIDRLYYYGLGTRFGASRPFDHARSIAFRTFLRHFPAPVWD